MEVSKYLQHNIYIISKKKKCLSLQNVEYLHLEYHKS